MKHPFPILSLLFVLFAGSLGARPVLAQSVTSAPGLPDGYSVIAPDYDRGDDEITQLNNLTIRGISSGSLPAVLYASRDLGGDCYRYSTTESRGVVYPCPLSLAPTVLYQIQVNPDTILLLKNRNRASFGTFAVGDRVNVYGFFDRDSQYMQGLIVRDLDKPTPASQSRYVQLNSVTLVSDPSSAYPPATFAVADSNRPCYYYSGPQGYRISTDACPERKIIESQSPFIKVSPYSHYQVSIGENTALLDLYRRRIPLSEFRTGDTVNIFGLYDPLTHSIQALIVRDLGTSSTIPPMPGNGSITVEVNDPYIRCITTPCGPIRDAKVELRRPDGTTSVQVTDYNGRTVFTNLSGGSYALTASFGGRSASAQVVLASGDKHTIRLDLPRDTASRVALSSVEPSSARIGGTVTLRGSGFAPSGNMISMNDREIVATASASNCVPSGDMNGGVSCATLVVEGVGYLPWSCPPGYGCAAVMRTLPPGTYDLRVVNANGTSNSVAFTLLPQ